jgi:hypothetical protein
MDVQVGGMTLRKDGTRRPVEWHIEGGTPAKTAVEPGAASHAGRCKGAGATWPDLATMPTGGSPTYIETDFASDPFKQSKG